jgi:hypothetical protein
MDVFGMRHVPERQSLWLTGGYDFPHDQDGMVKSTDHQIQPDAEPRGRRRAGRSNWLNG